MNKKQVQKFYAETLQRLAECNAEIQEAIDREIPTYVLPPLPVQNVKIISCEMNPLVPPEKKRFLRTIVIEPRDDLVLSLRLPTIISILCGPMGRVIP